MLGKQPIAFKVGLFILLIILLVGVFAPILAPCDPYQMGTPYLRPSAQHLLGTNDLGQDIFSELLYGDPHLPHHRTGVRLGSHCGRRLYRDAVRLFGRLVGRALMEVTRWPSHSLPAGDHCAGGIFVPQLVEHHHRHLHHRLERNRPDHPLPGVAAQGAALCQN